MKLCPFRRHRFSPAIILRAVRLYCRYPLSYRDVAELMAEHHDISLSPATIFRWVQKFSPLIAKRLHTQRSWRGLDWHVDETYIRVGGKWRYLWRAIDQLGQFLDFRLTARRNASAARAFIRQPHRI